MKPLFFIKGLPPVWLQSGTTRIPPPCSGYDAAWHFPSSGQPFNALGVPALVVAMPSSQHLPLTLPSLNFNVFKLQDSYISFLLFFLSVHFILLYFSVFHFYFSLCKSPYVFPAHSIIAYAENVCCSLRTCVHIYRSTWEMAACALAVWATFIRILLVFHGNRGIFLYLYALHGYSDKLWSHAWRVLHDNYYRSLHTRSC